MYSYLMHFLTKFHCPKLKTFSDRLFKGPHQVRKLLSEVPEEPCGIHAREAGGHFDASTKMADIDLKYRGPPQGHHEATGDV